MKIKLLNKYKILTGNVFQLSVLHVFNMIIPLLLIPFIIKSVGIIKYGELAFAITISTYALILVNFGFDYSGTKRISENRDNLEKISSILISVTLIKLLLFVIVLLIFFLVIIFLEDLDFFLYFFSIMMVLDSIFLPKWFFLGLEKVKYITIAYGVSKLISSLFIVYFLYSGLPISFIPLSYLIGIFFTGLYTWFIIKVKLKVSMLRVSKSTVFYEFNNSINLFYTNLSVNLYRNSTIFFGGFLLSPTQLGSYALAERIIKAIQSFSNPLTQALFPHFSLVSKMKGIKLVKTNIYKLAKIITPTIIFFIVLAMLAIENLKVFFDIDVIDNNIYILSPIILFGTLNFIFGYLGLVNLGFEKKVLRIMIIITLFNLLFTPAILYLNSSTSSLPLLITEIILFSLLLNSFRKIGDPQYEKA